ncbi:hypothetical protein TVAG_081100 [Trichomonas vaginalis G3]|uniref:Uncharacterized protein n=1 Tax=Trichomonas vaginalis (strain ATCC PRA-98 / G3) TaxID=412133 RepID=A2EPD3_TRIV3|nr:hypothetical protein TVAGG3_0679900 [Trichomonas vaginalis G3]EAY05518.1 hypothetical protein TVAG_081100 [Trichomonas vaginalis G3]KAI5507830.1 hypothetical protein TVAGG3_0679900 [Trichomonas vaginalis G3]|eukprot:XP_001317741.1 hypothetical protein [Trichomonas vaginalis G3]
MAEPEFIWVFSSDFEEDDDLDMIDDILYDVEESYDISQCDESKMISFLRKHNYDIDLLIDAGLNGEFGEFVSLNEDYEAEISSNGKVRVKKVSLTQNKQPVKTSAKASKKRPNKQSEAPNLEPIQLTFFGTQDSDATALINRVFGGKGSFSIRNREFKYDLIENNEEYIPTVANPVFVFNAINNSLRSDLMSIPQTLIPPNQVVDPDKSKPNQEVDPNNSDLNQEVDPDKSELNQEVDPDKSELNQEVDPNNSDLNQEEDKANEYPKPVYKKAIYIVLNKFDLVPKDQMEKLFNTTSARIRDIMKCNNLRNFHIIPISTAKDTNIFTKGYTFYQGDQFSKLLNFSL